MTKESLAVLKERMIGLKNRSDERVINCPRKKNFKKALVAGTLGLSLALGSAGVPNLNPSITTVEAARKDKKKPKIKMSGKKKYTVEEGENITIPKTTYSDNATKKKKLKVGVTVKKGKKNYKTIANKIKKATLKSKPVTVTFNDEGTYKITTTVTDLAKNKATAVRYITVNEKEEIIEEEKLITKEDPTTEVTTEKVTPEEKTTTEQKTTETPTTEKTTEEPKKEEATTEQSTTEETKEEITYPKDIARNRNLKQYIIDNITYNITDKSYIDLYTFNPNLDYTIGFENNYSYISMELDTEFLSTREYLKLLGKPIAYDSDGNDISNRVMIYDTSFSDNPSTGGYSIFIVVTDGNWNYNFTEIIIEIFDKGYEFPISSTDDSLNISTNPVVYATPRELTSKSGKKLVLENN